MVARSNPVSQAKAASGPPARSNGRTTRFTSSDPCPVCGGSDRDARGQAQRCHGFISDDRKTIFCARPEHAGQARQDSGSQCYAHNAKGPCRCGKEHAPADPKPPKLQEDHVYKYLDENGVVRYEVVRFRNPKTFRQRRVENGRRVWSMKGVELILYQLPRLLTADPDEPVWIVEGEKDVDNLGNKGLIASCNPMGAGRWRDSYSDVLKDRHVVILPDNDQPGRDHAQQVAQSLQGKARSIRLVEIPGPTEKGDVSDFLASGGTVDQLRTLAQKTAEWTGAPVPPATKADRLPHAVGGEGPEDPHRLARIYLAGRSHQDRATLVFHRGQFWRWGSGCYRPVESEELGAGLTSDIKAEFDRFNMIEIDEWKDRGKKDRAGRTCGQPETRKVTRVLLVNVEQALKGMGVISGEIEPPAWLIGNPPYPANEIIPCRNGLLHVPSFLEGKVALLPPTPAYFGCHALNFDFDPNASLPTRWLDFLESIFRHDRESIPALQMWMGYLLTADTSQQKIGLLIGPRRSGRGTIARITTALIGKENVAAPSMAEFGMPFGLQERIGKPLVIVGDARVSRKQDPAMAVERMLAISGGDSVQIDRKYLAPWSGRLPCRIMILSNEVPRLPDASRALPSRMLALRLVKSWLGKEDTELEGKLKAELPGILIWAIQGWQLLQMRGRFIQPQAGQSVIDEMAALGSPIGSFVEDVCELGHGFSEPTKDMFGRWKEWCESVNIKPGSDAEFGQKLRAFDASITYTKPRDPDKGVQIPHYAGIHIRTHTPNGSAFNTVATGKNGKPF